MIANKKNKNSNILKLQKLFIIRIWMQQIDTSFVPGMIYAIHYFLFKFRYISLYFNILDELSARSLLTGLNKEELELTQTIPRAGYIFFS